MPSRKYIIALLFPVLSLLLLRLVLGPRWDRVWIFWGAGILLEFLFFQFLLLKKIKSHEKRLLKIEKMTSDMPYLHRILRNTQKQLDALLFSLEENFQSLSEKAVSPGSKEALHLLQETVQHAKKMRAPRLIPAKLRNDYTMGGRIRVVEKYRDSTYLPEAPLVYEKEKIDGYVEQIHKKIYNYPRYGKTNHWLFEALTKYPIRNKKVALMGSNRPWFESVCIAYGSECTTIEYNRILTSHPKLKIITPEEYDQNPFLFDAALSISSFEHDGLGRFGDPLNPFGDLQAMKKMKTMVKSKGILFLAVPVGVDTLVWNAHRIYGRLRLPLLLEGWRTIDSFGFEDKQLDGEKNSYEPVLVLENA